MIRWRQLATCFITYLSKRFLQREEKAKIACSVENIAYMSGKDVVELSSARRIAQLQLHFAAPSHGQGRKRSLDGAVF